MSDRWNVPLVICSVLFKHQNKSVTEWHRSSLQLDSHRCSLWFCYFWNEHNLWYSQAQSSPSFFKWLTLMWIKALLYMNVGEGPQDVCGWRKCCTACSSLEFEHWWRVNPPLFLFLFFSSWTVIYVQWMRLVGLFSLSCAGIIFFFLYCIFLLPLLVRLCLWFGETSVLESAKLLNLRLCGCSSAFFFFFVVH